MMAECNHESLDICEEVVEEGPVAFADGDVSFSRTTELVFRCSFCGQLVPGEVPAFDNFQED